MRVFLQGLCGVVLVASPLSAAEYLTEVRSGSATTGQRSDAELLASGSDIEWPAAEVTLRQAVQRMNVQGNRLALADDVDPEQRIAMPAFRGTWWQGVDSIAAAFRVSLLLTMPDAVGSPDNDRATGVRMGVAMTDPVLGNATPQRAALVTTKGALRLELLQAKLNDKGLSGRLLVRVEPRLATLRAMTVDSRSTQASLQSPSWNAEDNRAQYKASIGVGHSTSPGFTVSAGSASAWSATAALANGDSLVVNFESGKSVRVRRDDAVGMIITGPPGVVGSMQTTFTRDGSELSARGGGSTSTADSTRLTRRFQNLAGGPVDVQLVGQAQQSAQAMQVPGFALDAFPLTSASGARHVALAATRVSWPEGSYRLHEVITRMTQQGVQLTVGLGVDEQATAVLPAFSGTFWESVLEVCRRYRISPALPDSGEAAVTLAMTSVAKHSARENAQWFTVGAFLVKVEGIRRLQVQTMNGIERRAQALVRIIPEPRSGFAAIVNPRLELSQSGDIAGIPCTIQSMAASAGNDNAGNLIVHHQGLHRLGRRFQGDYDSDGRTAQGIISRAIEFSGLPEGPCHVRMRGMLTARLHEQRDISLTVRPGGASAVETGEAAISAIVVSDEQFGLRYPGVSTQGQKIRNALLIMGCGQDDLRRLRVSDADGKQISNNQTMSLQSGGIALWFQDKKLSEEYVLNISDSRVLGQVQSLIDMQVVLP